ncbi:MAG: carboxymuconolactone decarboxylase family protein [Thermodesulfobacteriota bacterium]
MSNSLPAFFQEVSERFPEIFKAYSDLGETISGLGKMDAKTRELVRLGIAIGAGSEGAVHSQTRKAIAAHASDEEIVECALLAITAIGWPRAMASLTWIDDLLGDIKSE